MSRFWTSTKKEAENALAGEIKYAASYFAIGSLMSARRLEGDWTFSAMPEAM
jgi:hypothetical protein